MLTLSFISGENLEKEPRIMEPRNQVSLYSSFIC